MDDLKVLQNASHKACDGLDGYVDGIVDPSFHCHFDPATILCGANSNTTGGCLTQVQIDAANDIYAGPHDSRGNRITLNGAFPGYETDWADSFLDSDPTVWYVTALSSWTSYLFDDSYSVQDFDIFSLDWDNVPSVLMVDSIISPSNSDLTLFRANGGKLVIQIGWQDIESGPENAIAWYKRYVYRAST